MAKRGLGKGLSSLIPGADIETPASNNYTNTNIHTRTCKTVPISIDVEITNLGTSSDSYFTARNSKNANNRISGK